MVMHGAIFFCLSLRAKVWEGVLRVRASLFPRLCHRRLVNT